MSQIMRHAITISTNKVKIADNEGISQLPNIVNNRELVTVWGFIQNLLNSNKGISLHNNVFISLGISKNKTIKDSIKLSLQRKRDNAASKIEETQQRAFPTEFRATTSDWDSPLL